MIVSLLDYGTGNLHSLAKGFEACGAGTRIDDDPHEALQADALVLPGVGAFGAAAEIIAPAADDIRAALFSGFPCLGICLGMQLLFESSAEGDGKGLGIVPGHVRRLRAHRVPQMGWNSIENGSLDPLFAGMGEMVAYYANSFVAEPTDPASIIAWTTYETDRFAAAVHCERTWGVQFHPEKSSRDGLRILRRFLEEAAQRAPGERSK
jgi:glutamine amidotransferase